MPDGEAFVMSSLRLSLSYSQQESQSQPLKKKKKNKNHRDPQADLKVQIDPNDLFFFFSSPIQPLSFQPALFKFLPPLEDWTTVCAFSFFMSPQVLELSDACQPLVDTQEPPSRAHGWEGTLHGA